MLTPLRDHPTLKGGEGRACPPLRIPPATDESGNSSVRLSVDHRNAHLAKVHKFRFDLLQIFSQTLVFLHVEILNHRFNKPR